MRAKAKRPTELQQLHSQLENLSNRVAGIQAFFDNISRRMFEAEKVSNDVIERLAGIVIPDITEMIAFTQLQERVRRVEKLAAKGAAPTIIQERQDSHVSGGWMNIYGIRRDGRADFDTAEGLYVDKDAADLDASEGRIACILINDFRKGDGLL